MSRSNQLAGLITATPTSTLDTINEINASLNNDNDLAGSLTTLIDAKAPKASPTFTGDAVFDTDTLKVDATNNRVGIGGSPTEKFNVTEDRAANFASVIKNTNATGSGLKVIAGDTTEYSLIVRDKDDSTDSLVVLGNGNVGIGTTAPQKHVEIHDQNNMAYLLINGGGAGGSTTSALQLGGRSASGGNQLAEVSAIRIGDTRGQLVFSTKSSANTLTQRGGFYHGGRSNQREQAFAIQYKRIIYNWYDVKQTTQTYKHIKTSLWMGGTHSNSYGYSGNQMYWMGGWRIYGYRYASSSNIADTSFFFHNWGGNFANPGVVHSGSWNILHGYYTSSDGFCVLRLLANNYASVHMDMYQVYSGYPVRDVLVLAETDSNSSGNQF